jgi:hypothetical protein
LNTLQFTRHALDEEVGRLAGLLAANAPVAMRGKKQTINEFARDSSTRRWPIFATGKACAARRSRKA